MNTYEQLLSSSDENITVIEKNFKSKAKGLCKGNKIGISKKSLLFLKKPAFWQKNWGTITPQ